jgi:diguanylate cyclase (GGDEF)-like protein
MMSRAAIARSGEPHQSVIVTGDGRTIAIQQHPMPDGGWVATHEDITERRRAEEKISFLARHDALTGLPNRSLLMERIGEARVGALRGTRFAVLFLDLDRFKAVNDTLGHAVGDELLRSVAARLLAQVREGDTVARLGGDEFVVLQANLTNPAAAAVLSERIIKAVAAPYTIAGHEVAIGVSIGVDIATNDHASPDELLKNADMALYISKGEGRGTFRFFEPTMDAAVQNRHALERDLRCAMARGEFELYYQPIVGARSGEIRGFETLLRWNHPSRGLVLPNDFISVAEECGLIIELGEWVIRQACLQAARWPDHIHLAVNLSPVQFRAANLVDIVRDSLTAAGLPADRLELEITETVLLQGSQRNVAVMHQLRASGIGIVMDDFGVGYSSLSYLRRFPFNRVKIDQSFVRDLTTREDAIFIVRAIVGLCRNLGIRTTAEGIENTEQRDILLAEGCTELQGYLFSPPQPAASLGRIGSFCSNERTSIRQAVLF